MASILGRIAQMSESDISSLSRKELEMYVTKGSKLLRQNIRRVEKSGLYSQYINKRRESGKPFPKEIKSKTAEKMSTTDLKKQLREIHYGAGAKTSSVRGAKKMAKDFAQSTGTNINELTSEDWAEIRRNMEDPTSFGSSEEIAMYVESKNDGETIDEKRDKRIHQSFENHNNDEPNIEDVTEDALKILGF